MAWRTAWAPTASELNACVECGLCLPHCPTFRLTGDETASPRGRLNAMRAVARDEISIGAAFTEVMTFCLQCRACEAACPSLVPFGRAMEGARAEVAASRPRSGRFRRRLVGRWIARRWMVKLGTAGAALLQRLGGRRWLPRRARRGVGGLRRLRFAPRSHLGRVWEADGKPVGTVGLLVGCVMDPWFPGVHEATAALLSSAGYRVVAPDGQTCCGALAAHEGAAEEAAALAKRNAEAFTGVDLVVSNSAGCSAHLAGSGHWGDGDAAVSSIDAVALVARAIGDGRLPTLSPGRGTVAVQDPCHHRHALRMVDEPRLVLRAAGYEVVDVDPTGMCCGAAGIYAVLRPDTAGELGERKAAEIGALGVDLVATANPGCEIQLRSHLERGVRVVHPLEIYWESMVDSRR